jgi:hypothetical protein
MVLPGRMKIMLSRSWSTRGLHGCRDTPARVAATKAITPAIDRIATVDGPLGRHLRATIRTGLQCSYQPDPDDKQDWILD